MKKPIPFDLAQKEVESLIDAAELVANIAKGGKNIMGQSLPFEVQRTAMLKLRRSIRALSKKIDS